MAFKPRFDQEEKEGKKQTQISVITLSLTSATAENPNKKLKLKNSDQLIQKSYRFQIIQKILQIKLRSIAQHS